MSASIFITYKDPSRPEYYHPFRFQDVLRKQWWPLDEKHGLEMLKRIGALLIEDRAEAEQLVRELRFVEQLLNTTDFDGIPAGTTQYMRKRLAIILPVLDGALAEWDIVKEISI